MTKIAAREVDLKGILFARQSELRGDVQQRLRDSRTGRTTDGHDEVERSDANSQGDLEFALLQMRTETLARIDDAPAARRGYVRVLFGVQPRHLGASGPPRRESPDHRTEAQELRAGGRQ